MFPASLAYVSLNALTGPLIVIEGVQTEIR